MDLKTASAQQATPSPSAAELTTILNDQAHALLILQEDGTIRLANAAAARLMRKGSRDLEGTRLDWPLSAPESFRVNLAPSEQEPHWVTVRPQPILWTGQPAVAVSLQEYSAPQQLLTEISAVLTESLAVATATQALANLLVRELADVCLIDVVESQAHLVRTLTHRDPERQAQADSLLQQESSAPFSQRQWLQAMAGRQPEVYAQLTGDGWPGKAVWQTELRFFHDCGCHAALFVPIVAHGRTLGAMLLGSTAARPLCTPADLLLAIDVAQRTALALENSRLYHETQEAVRRRDEFLAILAHELRNPLAPILQAGYLLEQFADRHPEVMRFCDVIQHQGRQMARLLSELLEVSRVACGKITLRKEPVDLKQVLQAAMQSCQSFIDASGHELIVSLPWRPILLDADAARLEQIFVNLLNNAAKYTPGSGQIFVSVSCEAAEVSVRIRDTGVGIAPEMLQRIFEMFTQVEPALDRTACGLGIGLALVRDLVELHEGQIRVHSEGLGKGSEFEVRLPLSSAPAKTAAASPTLPCDTVPPAPPASADKAAPAPPPPGTCHILLVEDNVDAREMLCEILQLHGHRVDCAGDGLSAVDLALALRPDLALVDIGLPKLDGYQVAEQIRSRWQGQPVRLVALTGYGKPEDRRRAAEAGFDAHLVKPIDIQQLMKHIEQWTRS